jgi:hypothetical protein
VGGEHDDRAACSQFANAIRHHTDRAIVEAGKRLVEKDEPRIVQQCPFERETLPHPSRKSGDIVVCAFLEAGPRERGFDSSRANAVQLSEESQVLPCRQLRVEVQLVCEQAKPAP